MSYWREAGLVVKIVGIVVNAAAVSVAATAADAGK